MQPTVTSPPSKKKGKYDITFKLKVIQWAEKHSNRAAGSKFGLNESTIRGWRKSAVANSLDALGDFSRGVLSLHQPIHGSGPAAGSPSSLQTSGLHALAAASNRVKLHDPLRSRRPMNGGVSSTNQSMSGIESGGESPAHSIAAMDDERELARLSCSPSDDGYYEDVGYHEEVVQDDDQVDGQAGHLQMHRHLPSPSPTPSPPPPPPAPCQPQGPILKTISHQVPSKPFPEIQLPFTVIVCKSVRDHWLQRYASQKPVHPATEFDTFAQHLGLERR